MTIAALVKSAPLRRGAKGPAVEAVQRALVAAGHELVPDGDFGRITEAAVVRFDVAHGLPLDRVVDVATAVALDQVRVPRKQITLPSVIAVAPWLSVMRAISGTKEFPGAANNPIILEWVNYIVTRYPELRSGVGWYKHDATPWCGLGCAYSTAKAGFRPPLAPLWALNWAKNWADGVQLPGPALGAIAVMSRNGGGHVTEYEGENATHWFGRGPNQSDMVNVAKFPHSRKVTWMWPRGAPLPTGGRVRTSFDATVSVREG